MSYFEQFLLAAIIYARKCAMDRSGIFLANATRPPDFLWRLNPDWAIQQLATKCLAGVDKEQLGVTLMKRGTE